jgi:hypothetical protein
MRLLLSLTILTFGALHASEPPQVTVTNIRRVFHNGEHNAFTDLVPLPRSSVSDLPQLSGWTHGQSHGIRHHPAERG